MSFADTRSDGTVEECLDELNDLMAGLQRYSPTVLAMAMRVHLGRCCRPLLEAQLCTREELRDFVRELERDALQYDEDETGSAGKRSSEIDRYQRLSGGWLVGNSARSNASSPNCVSGSTPHTFLR